MQNYSMERLNQGWFAKVPGCRQAPVTAAGGQPCFGKLCLSTQLSCSSSAACSVDTSTELIDAHSCSGSCQTTGMSKDMSCIGRRELERTSESISQCLAVHSVARRDAPCPAPGAEGMPWCTDEKTGGYRRRSDLPRCVSPHTGMNTVRSTWGWCARSPSQYTAWHLQEHMVCRTCTSPRRGCGSA